MTSSAPDPAQRARAQGAHAQAAQAAQAAQVEPGHAHDGHAQDGHAQDGHAQAGHAQDARAQDAQDVHAQDAHARGAQGAHAQAARARPARLGLGPAQSAQPRSDPLAPPPSAPRPPVSRTVLFGALALVPPVGVLVSILAASLVRGPGPLVVTGWMIVAAAPGAFFGIEAATRARKELRRPREARPRLAEVGLGLGAAGAVVSALLGILVLLFVRSFS